MSQLLPPGSTAMLHPELRWRLPTAFPEHRAHVFLMLETTALGDFEHRQAGVADQFDGPLDSLLDQVVMNRLVQQS